MDYRESSYFNENDTFLFERNDGRRFESKCHFEKGFWWTNESLNYKCISIMCVNLSDQKDKNRET
jgi:hypothetical protein